MLKNFRKKNDTINVPKNQELYKGTSINCTFKNLLTMTIITFAYFMSFLRIFPSFFQQHSSLTLSRDTKTFSKKNS